MAIMELTSEINSVTIYSDRALVQRTGNHKIAQGEHLLVFTSLPENIDTNSIQVNGTGNFMLKDIRPRKKYQTGLKDEEISRLNTREEKLEDELKIASDTISHVKSEKEIVEAIARKVSSLEEKPENIELDPEKWIKLIDFYRTKLDKLDEEIRNTEKQRKKLHEELNTVQQQRKDLGNQQQKIVNIVEVLVEAAEETNVELQLTYVVNNASWYPVYDLRVSAETKQINLSYNAIIQQSTTENWQDVTLALSTAKPSIAGKTPKLNPWYISVYDSNRDFDFDDDMDIPEGERSEPKLSKKVSFAKTKAAVKPKAKVKSGATSVLFKIPGQHLIKSDNQQHKVTITVNDMDAEFSYSTVPKLSSFAYLSAEFINKTEFPLLKGKTNVFLDNAFVAVSQMGPVFPGETFTTYLGVDESIKIAYKLLKKLQKDEGIFTKKIKLQYDYLITIKNTKRTEENILVRDQLPIPQHNDIEVKLISPDYKEDSEELKKDKNAFLNWQIKVQSGEEKKILLQFSVEYPRNMDITGI